MLQKYVTKILGARIYDLAIVGNRMYAAGLGGDEGEGHNVGPDAGGAATSPNNVFVFSASSPVPEPSSVLFVALGGLGFLRRTRR